MVGWIGRRAEGRARSACARTRLRARPDLRRRTPGDEPRRKRPLHRRIGRGTRRSFRRLPPRRVSAREQPAAGGRIRRWRQLALMALCVGRPVCCSFVEPLPSWPGLSGHPRRAAARTSPASPRPAGRRTVVVRRTLAVMAGLVPAIHAGPPQERVPPRRGRQEGGRSQGFSRLPASMRWAFVDGRDKPGHDALMAPSATSAMLPIPSPQQPTR